MTFELKPFLQKPVHAAPLAMFRIIFGFMMVASIVRFILKGWVTEQYVLPKVYFSYYGFEWVKPLGETGMYLLFGLAALSALGLMLGLFYRLSATLFFLSFTYIELIDKTNYLNHYYFVSIVAFLLILVPAHRHFSLDVVRKPQLWVSHVPNWTIFIFQLQLGLVYFYAGAAKLNSDWLLDAMPLRIWLPANTHLPILGPFLDYIWVAYLFSWFGALYDLTIPFFLVWRKSRPLAYITVIVFHVLTAVLFQIGMFPYIMMLSTLVFFSEDFHKKAIRVCGSLFRVQLPHQRVVMVYKSLTQRVVAGVLVVYFVVQVLVPWRFLLYPDKLFWTEQGYRFSWRVMLMEKGGTAFFYVRDSATGFETEVMNRNYLTPQQEKMMATQPDMILQFAKIIEQDYIRKGMQAPEVRAECYVAMNGRSSRLLIDPHVNLAALQEGFSHKSWILPYNMTEQALQQALQQNN